MSHPKWIEITDRFQLKEVFANRPPQMIQRLRDLMHILRHTSPWIQGDKEHIELMDAISRWPVDTPAGRWTSLAGIQRRTPRSCPHSTGLMLNTAFEPLARMHNGQWEIKRGPHWNYLGEVTTLIEPLLAVIQARRQASTEEEQHNKQQVMQAAWHRVAEPCF